MILIIRQSFSGQALTIRGLLPYPNLLDFYPTTPYFSALFKAALFATTFCLAKTESPSMQYFDAICSG